MVHGGAQMRTVELMPLLAQRGVRCDVCTLIAEPGPLEDYVRRAGGDVHRCQLRPGLLTFPRRLKRILDIGQYDIVHSHVHYASGYIMWLAHRYHIPGRVIHFRSTGDGRPDTFRRLAYRRLMRHLADRHATAIVAVSRAAMEHAWGGQWQREPRARVIYNGLDLTPFQQAPRDPTGVRAELGLPPDSLIAINVGRIDPPKAHDVLLDAFANVLPRVAHLHLVLAGDGELKSEMQHRGRSLGLQDNVHFLGVRDDVPRLLKGSDCFVLSSRREGMPGAVLEALAAQLPIVATDLPAVRELAEHTSLITMAPVEDPLALSRAMLTLLVRIENREISPVPFPTAFDLVKCADNMHTMYLRTLGDKEDT